MLGLLDREYAPVARHAYEVMPVDRRVGLRIVIVAIVEQVIDAILTLAMPRGVAAQHAWQSLAG